MNTPNVSKTPIVDSSCPKHPHTEIQLIPCKVNHDLTKIWACHKLSGEGRNGNLIGHVSHVGVTNCTIRGLSSQQLEAGAPYSVAHLMLNRCQKTLIRPFQGMAQLKTNLNWHRIQLLPICLLVPTSYVCTLPSRYLRCYNASDLLYR